MNLSLKQKNILDRVAWLLGTVGGFVTANMASLPPDQQALASFAGLLLGDVASDLIGVAAGTLTAATVEQQASQAISTPAATAFIQGQIAKLPATEQPTANAALGILQAQLAKVPTAPAA